MARLAHRAHSAELDEPGSKNVLGGRKSVVRGLGELPECGIAGGVGP